MSKLPGYKRLTTSDFEEKDKQLVEQMSIPLNDAIGSLYFAVGGNLTLKDNMLGTVKDIEVVVNATGTPTTQTSFRLDKTFTVLGCQVIKADNQTNSSVYPTGQPFISFVQNGNNVIINNITNLQANNRYIVRIVAYA